MTISVNGSVVNPFQFIFNRAETISINRRAVTSQTQSRDNTVRTVKRGGQSWRFDVKLPDGMPWDEVRPYLEAIEYYDRYTTGTVQITGNEYNQWFTKYQGSAAAADWPTGFTATATEGSSELTLTTTPAIPGGGRYFASGDIIQLGTNGHVYSVVGDVTDTTVQLNRPVTDASGSYQLVIGPNVTWSVVCVSMPTWTIFARNQIGWSGSFVFYENML